MSWELLPSSDSFWNSHFQEHEVALLKEHVLCSREAFESFMKAGRGGVLSSSETYVEDTAGGVKTETKGTKRGRRADDDAAASAAKQGSAQLLHTPQFRMRVRKAIFDNVVDAQLFPEQAHQQQRASPAKFFGPTSTFNRELFLVSAPEDPLPVFLVHNEQELHCQDRYYSLEIDQNDWENRETIVKEYASFVRKRIRELDDTTSAASSSVTVKTAPAGGSSNTGPGDGEFDLPPLHDVKLESMELEGPPGLASPIMQRTSASSAAAASSSSFGFQTHHVSALQSPMPPPPLMPGFLESGGAGGGGGAADPFHPSPWSQPLPPPELHTPAHLTQKMSGSFSGGAASVEASMDEDDGEGGTTGVKSRRKWIKMERVPGQVELYKALEKALKDLRDCKQHSFPFLQRVKKTEAPDYYTIIKTPMHFAEINRKLNLNLYLSKREFENDLNLIWANCRRYNTDPTSVFLTHCAEMEKRQARTMKKVPDTDLTPYKDVIQQENSVAGGGGAAGMTPSTPRMMLANSVDNMSMSSSNAFPPNMAGLGTAPPSVGSAPSFTGSVMSPVTPHPATPMGGGGGIGAVAGVPTPSTIGGIGAGAGSSAFGLGSVAGGGATTLPGLSSPTLPSALGSPTMLPSAPSALSTSTSSLQLMNGPLYPSLITPPEKRRKALLEASDTEIFNSVFDPILSAEIALAGKPVPADVAFLPPEVPLSVRNEVTPQILASVCTTLSQSPAPGPIPMPRIVLPDDNVTYPDVHERLYVQITRAIRVKALTDCQVEETAPFSERSPIVRRSGEMGFFYAHQHPDLVTKSLEMLLTKKPMPLGSGTTILNAAGGVATVTQAGAAAPLPGTPATSAFAPSTAAVGGAAAPLADVSGGRAAPAPPSTAFPRGLAFPEMLGSDVMPEAPFYPTSVLCVNEKEYPIDEPELEPIPEVAILTPDQRSKNLLIDCVRTISRAKMTRETMQLFHGGYGKEAAEPRTLSARGLLDETNVQTMAAKLLSPAAETNRRATALHTNGSMECYLSLLDRVVVLFLTRMGMDLATRQSISLFSDILVSRISMFAEHVKRECDGNTQRDMSDVLGEALSVFGVNDPRELLSYYDTHVAKYAEQMLVSEAQLKDRLQSMEAERQKKQELLNTFLKDHATEGSELKKVHDLMVEAQNQMQSAQKQYYDAKNKNIPQLMAQASASYTKGRVSRLNIRFFLFQAQEAFRSHAKSLAMAQEQWQERQNKMMQQQQQQQQQPTMQVQQSQPQPPQPAQMPPQMMQQPVSQPIPPPPLAMPTFQQQQSK